MSLSYDLISEFVKITNDKKENTKEGTVYATVVSGTGGKYVRIDGSDLLTPTDTTTDIEDGERVTLMIKDHKAIVTGNVTTPSASTSKVDKVNESINSVSDRVGTFELVVADKISTKELEAYKATIDILVANKATIEDLTATNAKIENLEAKNAEIENLVAEKATITDLEAVNATIDNLKAKDAEIENAVIENLDATMANIKVLNADFAQIKTLVNGNLTSDNILSFNLTSEKVTVDDAFIKDAMIDTISAGKINAGKINTNSVSIGSEDGGMLITGSTQQFTDKNGNVRIQIGKDASGDFTFILYGEDGTGQLINQNGITASAISDGLIVNDMVSDHAAISGGKLDISSVITEINGDTSTTIKSSKIYLNDQAQSLEVAFNSLKTKVDTIQEVTIQGDLTAIVEQVQSNTSKIEVNSENITTLISENTTVKKEVTDLQGTLNETKTSLTSKYTSLDQSLQGFKTTVADTYATKKSVTDIVDNISANYSTTSVTKSAIEQKVEEISLSVSNTYATKNEVNTLDDNLKTNYSTTKQMESAISVAKEEINLEVSNIYETKTNVDSKAESTLESSKTYTDSEISVAKEEINLGVSTTYETKTNVDSKAASTLESAKTYTDSEISVAKEEINLSVSNTYETKTNVTGKINDILIGGRNLAKRSNYFNKGTCYSGINSILHDDGSVSVVSSMENEEWFGNFIITSEGIEDNFNEGDTFTISFIVSSENTTTIPDIYIKSGMKNCPLKGTLSSNDSLIYYTGKWKKDNAIDIWLNFRYVVGTIRFKRWKIEKGNKPTDWSPAPEDTESDISAIESETRSIKETVSSLVLGADSISASVKSLEETMTSTTNGLSNDISKVQEQVSLAMTSSDVQLEIQKQMSNGSNKVSTTTGYTFDENGLNISKSDSEMQTQITEDGMKIYKNSETMLTANNQGVDAKNLHATTYLIIGENSRMEDYIENGGWKRTAVFWIGG